MRDLEDGEFVIDDKGEVLRRQVAPAMFDGKPMKGAFDDDKTSWMSTLRGTVDPEVAYERWIERGNASVGTYGINVGAASELGAPSVDDSERLEIADHASVVLEDISGKARVRLSRKLRDLAHKDGPLYAP